MKKILVFMWLLFMTASLYAQSMYTIKNDTVYTELKYLMKGTGSAMLCGMRNNTQIVRFFQRNAMYPRESEDRQVCGISECWFVVDKTGTVTQAWSEDSAFSLFSKELLRVINRLPVLNATVIDGRTAITKIKVTAIFQFGDSCIPVLKGEAADFTVMGFELQRKRVMVSYKKAPFMRTVPGNIFSTP